MGTKDDGWLKRQGLNFPIDIDIDEEEESNSISSPE